MQGRKSAAARSMLATMVTLEQGARPKPPVEFKLAEVKEWHKVVNSMPPDWFTPESHGLLEQYCKIKAGLLFVDKVIAQLENAPKLNLVEWKRIVKIRHDETKLLTILATKMRLAQQSSYDKVRVKEAKARAGIARALPDVPDTAAAPTRPWS